MSEAKMTDERLAELRCCDTLYNSGEADELFAEIDRLRKIVGKLPKTADGVPITLRQNLFAVIKMNDMPTVYEVVECGFVSLFEGDSDGDPDWYLGVVRDGNGMEYDVGTDQVYFTREAALTPKPAGSPAQQKEQT